MVVVVLLAGLSGFLANKPAEIQVVNQTSVLVVEKEVANNPLVDEMAADYLENKYDEQLQNDTAKALVLAEIAKRDFKKDVFSILEANKSVEDYKDLTIYSVKVEDIELNDESATVTVVFKVSGFEDDDEESDFKARFRAVFEVEGLDVEDLDEEIADTEITLEKFYD
jgi:hypothetical protein